MYKDRLVGGGEAWTICIGICLLREEMIGQSV